MSGQDRERRRQSQAPTRREERHPTHYPARLNTSNRPNQVPPSNDQQLPPLERPLPYHSSRQPVRQQAPYHPTSTTRPMDGSNIPGSQYHTHPHGQPPPQYPSRAQGTTQPGVSGMDGVPLANNEDLLPYTGSWMSDPAHGGHPVPSFGHNGLFSREEYLRSLQLQGLQQGSSTQPNYHEAHDYNEHRAQTQQRQYSEQYERVTQPQRERHSCRREPQ